MKKSILEEVQEYVVDQLMLNDELSGVTFLAENRKDIDYEVKNHLGRQGIVGIVMTPKVTYAGKKEDLYLAWTLEELEIDIIENVTVNRGQSDFITGQAAAMKAVEWLCPTDGSQEGQFNPVSVEEGEDNGLLVNKCILKALVYGDPQENRIAMRVVKLLDSPLPEGATPRDGWMWPDGQGGYILWQDGEGHQIGGGGVTPEEMSAYVDSAISSKADVEYLNNYLPLSGGTVTGNIDFDNGQTAIIREGGGLAVKDWRGDIWALYDGNGSRTQVVRMQDISAKADVSALANYYEKSETSSAAEISAALESIEPPDPTLLSGTTYAGLKAARDAGQLVPGMWYRITDYECTTNGDMSSSVESHPFDILTMADSVSSLNEQCKACRREGSSEYASNDLEAWTVWYDLDNDIVRFAWADGTWYYVSDIIERYKSFRYPRLDAPGQPFPYAVVVNSTGTVYWLAAEPEQGVPVQQARSPEGPLWNTITPIGVRSATGSGKGVVYRLIDDLDNDFPFDFKQMMTVPYGGTSPQLALKNTSETHAKSSRMVRVAARFNIDTGYIPRQTLNNVVFACAGGTHCEFGPGCHDVTVNGSNSSVASDLEFGPGCYAVKLCVYGSSTTPAQNTVFGPGCHDMDIRPQASNCVFGDSCYGLYALGTTQFNGNVFGPGCHDIAFNNSAMRNVFGPLCYAISATTATNSQVRDCVFGSQCSNIQLQTRITQRCTFAPGTAYLDLSSTTNNTNNVDVKPGVMGTAAARKQVTVTGSAAYCTTVKPADSVELEV